MTIRNISDKFAGNITCFAEMNSMEAGHAITSDLINDVLTVRKENMVIRTGLLQTVCMSHHDDRSDRLYANCSVSLRKMKKYIREEK